MSAVRHDCIGYKRMEQTQWDETVKAMAWVAQGEVVSGEWVHVWLQGTTATWSATQ